MLQLSDEMQAETARLGEASAALSEIAARTTEQAIGASTASEETSVNVRSVASAAEEMSASIGEITSQVNASSEMAVGAADDVARSTAAVSNLNGVVERVGDVTAADLRDRGPDEPARTERHDRGCAGRRGRKGLRGRRCGSQVPRRPDRQGDRGHCASDRLTCAKRPRLRCRRHRPSQTR